MRFLLRILSILLLFAAALMLFAIAAGLIAGRLGLASLAGTAFAGTLCFFVTRTAVWLWSSRPFWQDDKRLAEVAVALLAVALVPVLARLEQIHGDRKVLLHIGSTVVIGGIYVLSRILTRLCMRRTPGSP